MLWGLALLPEIVYVKDIYSGSYKRANTMFKLTYQAFIMFGISWIYLYQASKVWKGLAIKILASISLFAFV